MLNHAMRYVIIIIGCLLAAAAYNLFLIPMNFLSGGLAGIAFILYYLFSLPIGIMNFLLNIPILYIAYRYFGRLYFFDTILGTILFSVALDLTAFLNAYPPLSEPMLCAIVGGVISGIGFGLIFRSNCNTGGVDVIAALIKKLYSYNVGTMVFVLDCLIILSSVWLFDYNIAVYTFICMYIGGVLTNKMIDGFNMRKSIMIITEKPEAIADAIMIELDRGVTFLYGQGAYTKNNRKVIYVVITMRQVSRIKELTLDIDKNAFFIISDAREVTGEGFSHH